MSDQPKPARAQTGYVLDAIAAARASEFGTNPLHPATTLATLAKGKPMDGNPKTRALWALQIAAACLVVLEQDMPSLGTHVPTVGET